MVELTLIQVTRQTASKLKGLKIARFDTYDEIINRLFVKKEV